MYLGRHGFQKLFWILTRLISVSIIFGKWKWFLIKFKYVIFEKQHKKSIQIFWFDLIPTIRDLIGVWSQRTHSELSILAVWWSFRPTVCWTFQSEGPFWPYSRCGPNWKWSSDSLPFWPYSSRNNTKYQRTRLLVPRLPHVLCSDSWPSSQCSLLHRASSSSNLWLSAAAKRSNIVPTTARRQRQKQKQKNQEIIERKKCTKSICNICSIYLIQYHFHDEVDLGHMHQLWPFRDGLTCFECKLPHLLGGSQRLWRFGLILHRYRFRVYLLLRRLLFYKMYVLFACPLWFSRRSTPK